jgi:hypothetical protein
MKPDAHIRTIDVEFHLDLPKRTQPDAKRHRSAPDSQIPRLARLVALAIKCLGMVENGEILDYAELARVGYVTRARMSQIMNLVNLAPDIQEEILFLPKASTGRFPLTETRLRRIAYQPLWDRQRIEWRKLRQECQC